MANIYINGICYHVVHKRLEENHIDDLEIDRRLQENRNKGSEL